MSNPDWLARAAQRSQDETWLLGHVFARYRDLEARSQEELAKELGCTPEVLDWLSLCRRPEGKDFTEQVSAIARRFALEWQSLVRVLRHVEVLDSMKEPAEPGAAEQEGPALIAARDRDKDEEPSS